MSPSGSGARRYRQRVSASLRPPAIVTVVAPPEQRDALERAWPGSGPSYAKNCDQVSRSRRGSTPAATSAFSSPANSIVPPVSASRGRRPWWSVRSVIDSLRGSHTAAANAPCGSSSPRLRPGSRRGGFARRLGSADRAPVAEGLAVEGERNSGFRIEHDAAVLAGKSEGDILARRRELELLPGAPQHRPRSSASEVGRTVLAQDADKARHQRRVQLSPSWRETPCISTSFFRGFSDAALKYRRASRLSVTEDANPPVARGNDRQHVPKRQTSGGLTAAAPR